MYYRRCARPSYASPSPEVVGFGRQTSWAECRQPYTNRIVRVCVYVCVCVCVCVCFSAAVDHVTTSYRKDTWDAARLGYPVGPTCTRSSISAYTDHHGIVHSSGLPCSGVSRTCVFKSLVPAYSMCKYKKKKNFSRCKHDFGDRLRAPDHRRQEGSVLGR
jgi:hypothetical protein